MIKSNFDDVFNGLRNVRRVNDYTDSKTVEIDMPEQPQALMVFAPNQLPGYVVVNTAASVDADAEAVIIEDQLPQEVAEWIKSMPYTEV